MIGARSVRSVPARAVGRAQSTRDRSARWRDLRGLPPYPIARPLAQLWRQLGVKKLAPTVVTLIGLLRRARRQGFAGAQLTVEQWAELAGCTVRTVQRSLRTLERHRLFRAVPQYVNEPWTAAGGRRYERRQVATVYVFDEVGRFTCDTRPPAPTARRAWRELVRAPSEGVTRCRPNDSRTSSKELVPESAPAAPTVLAIVPAELEAPREEVSPAATVPDACRRPQSNAPATPAMPVGERTAPARPGAFGEGEGAAASGPPERAAPPLARWLAFCPDFAASSEREDPAPESRPGAADRASRGES